ncbi:hypothetical protein JMY81_21290 [Brenneria goodwinii]|uniref:hypothetical protein n=1 Tax=Brenneria goodwinii TaxID=1109412 RepID=UPI000EF1F459|nr:hypothetical protein [Brenneria goodwinii]MCG8156397.1 hypothetical protein [Brenneria goodwinii]MCG8163328.1 hypothetical protein [Brenneria goodwinii]MCG8167748.1 hypothetical protein [Brenneria goodwinii]MCG8172227.1 hypothetical protein [Brenneria goodwinii]MCG8175202.1 hypothetical protein [Brenneria goodwinii]
MKIKTVGARLLFFLLVYWTLVLSLFCFIAKLAISFIFFLKDSVFYFDWINAATTSLKTGIAVGIPLGVGIWIMSRLRSTSDAINQKGDKK